MPSAATAGPAPHRGSTAELTLLMEANIARDCKHGRSGPTPHLPYEKIALSPTPSPHHLWQVRELVGIGHTHFQLQPSGEQPLKPSRTGPGGVGAGELTLRALKAGELPPPFLLAAPA